MAQENKDYYYDRNGYNTYGVRGKASGGAEVVANPTLAGTENSLNGLQVGDIKYKVDSGMTNPMTTVGDLIVAGSNGTPTRLPKGTVGQVLTMKTGATTPEWDTPSDVTKLQMINTMGVEYNETTGANIYGTADINDEDSIGVQLVVPIKAGDGIAIDADGDNEMIEVGLDSTTTGTLNRALLKPASAPANNQLVGINTSNAQANLNLGTGLAVSGGAVNVTGVGYLTTAPTANNTAGDLKVVVLSSEPATRYTGWWYIITSPTT